MSTSNRIQRYKIVDGVEFCLCTKENIFKPCDLFTPKVGGHGFHYYCRKCAKELQKKDYVPNPKDWEKKGCNELLTKMGYDFDSDLTIHQQFLKKYFNDTI